MTEILTLLKHLRKKNVHVERSGDNLKLRGSTSSLTAEDKERIRVLKKDLLTFFLISCGTAAIPVLPEMESYRVSAAQQRLWILDQFSGGGAAYNVPAVYSLRGSLDVQRLQNAFLQIVKRHEILRTGFRKNASGELRQFIQSAEECAITMNVNDLRFDSNLDGRLRDLIASECGFVFNLEEGPLLRGRLVRIDESEWVLTYVMPHIVSDGWSTQILTRELLNFYNNHTRSQEYNLSALRIQYKDYAAWQCQQANTSEYASHRDYWVTKLSGDLPLLRLSLDKTRPVVKTFNGNVVQGRLSEVSIEKLATLCSQGGGTLFMGLLSMTFLTLFRVTGQNDIVIGMPMAGRDHPDLENQVGLYLNILPLRIQPRGEMRFNEFFEEVKELMVEAYQHQSYPFDSLMRDLRIARDASRNPVFDVLIDFQARLQYESKIDSAQGLSICEFGTVDRQVSKFDLTFYFRETSEGLILSLEYNSDLFYRSSIERMFGYFERLLGSVVSGRAVSIGQLSYVGEEEIRLLKGFTDQRVLYGEHSVVDLFREQASRVSDSPAIVFGEKKLSYGDLDRRSDQLGWYLKEHYGLKPGDRIGLMMNRSDLMIIGVLGILKSGCGYVPIDAEYPLSRKEFMMKDSGIKVLLTESEYIFDVSYYGGSIIALDLQLEALSSSPVAVSISGEDVAYVIYTSGSTGTPKGCVISHGSVSNYIQWANGFYFKEERRADFALFTSLSFDLTVTSIFCCLTQGGCLRIYDQGLDLAEILRLSFREDSGVNAMKLTPSHLAILGQLTLSGTGVRSVIVGGEELGWSQVEILRGINPAISVYNEYGPTEATVGCVVHEVGEAPKGGGRVPIGKPISNTGIYVVDGGGGLCGIGVVGEICIGGKGVARGYLNNKELTGEKFVENPFVSGDRMYRTGDLGRWQLDGTIDFLGRRDSQVKVRGYRIELGEIEHALSGHGEVKQSVVVARSVGSSEKELVAYVSGSSSLTVSDLRSYLSERVPQYMVPTYYVMVEDFPLTVNGKIDRGKLPSPEGSLLGDAHDYVAPRTEAERDLVGVFEDVLQRGGVGVSDDFFALGGDSIKAIQISIALGKLKFTATVADIFTYPTIRQLALFIEAHQAAGKKIISFDDEIIPTELRESLRLSSDDIYPVSDMQQIMIEQYDQDTERRGIYHSLTQFTFRDEGMSVHSFEQAVIILQQNNPVLRTMFIRYEGTMYQCIRKDACPVEHYDLRNIPIPGRDRRVQRIADGDFKNKFFSRQALIRFKLIKLSDDTYVFMMSFHHAIIDGWGDTVLQNELMDYYLRLRTSMPTESQQKVNSFKQHVSIGRRMARNEQMISFWKKETEQYHPGSFLKIERKGREGRYGFLDDVLESRLVKDLRSRAQHDRVSLRAVFLATWAEALQNIFDRIHLSVAVVLNGRTTDLQDALKSVGLFWNMLPFFVDEQYNSYPLIQERLNKMELNSRFPASEVYHWLGDDPNCASFNFIHFHNSVDWLKARPDERLPEILDIKGVERFHYPINICLAVSPHQENKVTVTLDYDISYVPGSLADILLAKFKSLLENISLYPIKSKSDVF